MREGVPDFCDVHHLRVVLRRNVRPMYCPIQARAAGILLVGMSAAVELLTGKLANKPFKLQAQQVHQGC